MQQTPYKPINPAFLVEGHLEQELIASICKGQPVQRIGCNGTDVCMAAIAKAVGSKARLLKNYSPIVILFDREGRSKSREDLLMEFIELLKNEGINSDIIVGMPDRHIENWILADPETLVLESGITPDQLARNFESTAGKVELKKLLPSDVIYHERIEGVKWLKKCRSNVIFSKSPSFARFAEQLEYLGCWWLGSIKLNGHP